jgi:DNA-binding NarL/FixJ family response regulator/tRNA A-37 threonylcarbamoyl transferase component Bud32
VAEPDGLITIVLADDHALVRSGLRHLLEAEEGFAVVAEAGDADSAVDLTRAHRPKVVLLDLNMPGTPSIDRIPDIIEASPGVAVVMLTMHDDAGYARDALSAGASAYVLKDAADAQLVAAVRAALAGRHYLDPGLGARMATTPPRPVPATAQETPTGDLAVGSTFAGHRIDAVAGRGGMGVVYRATDLVLHRRVALKLIAPSLARDQVFRARFEQECRLAAAIDHPHAVDVFHAGQEGGLLYVTMRFVEGTDLRALLREEYRLKPARAVRLVSHVAGALDEAHAHGLVHRDVKPANVLIAVRGGVEKAFLTDFGLTKERAVAADLTGTGLAIGTADYIAPEQAQGTDLDGRADVYALGCVLFQAVSGVVPFARPNDLEKMWAHVHDPPPDLVEIRPELPPALGDVVARAMAKKPDDRQATAGELAREAAAALVD